LKRAGSHRSTLGALTVAALGIVFGDIGTSPLYAMRECFNKEHGIALTESNVMGVLSLIFWALTLIVSLKYVAYVLRADNKGEGGIMALMALVLRGAADPTRARNLMLLGLLYLGRRRRTLSPISL